MVKHTVSNNSILTHGPNTIIRGNSKHNESKQSAIPDPVIPSNVQSSTDMSINQEKRVIVLRKTSIGNVTTSPLKRLGGSMRNVTNLYEIQVNRSPLRVAKKTM